MTNAAPVHPILDQDLVQHVREGSESAFYSLFAAYSSELVAFSTRMVGSEAIAEELVQDVLLTLWRDRAVWRVETNVRAYLFGAVRNRSIQYLKHERVEWRSRERVVAEFRDARGEQEPSNPADEYARALALDAAVARAVAELPPRCHQAFTLRWQRGLSYAEIAEVMRLSERTVENQLARALKILRRTVNVPVLRSLS